MAVFSSRSDRVTKTSSKKIGGSAEIGFQTSARSLVIGKLLGYKYGGFLDNFSKGHF